MILHAPVVHAPAIPPHPTTEMPWGSELAFTIFLGIPVVIGIYVALRHIAQGRGPLLAVCLLGGSIACLWEPIVDVLGLVYIREGANLTTFASMGRDFPLFINFVYVWYVGGLAYLAYRVYQNGITTKQLFMLYALDACINIGLESPGVLMGAYEYYGPQPLNFWGLPLWWVTVNPVMPMLIGAVIYRLSPYLTGWRVLAIAMVIPMADGAVNAATAWPVWTALNLDAPLVVTHLAAAVTLGLALFMVWMISLAVARDDEPHIAARTKRELLAGAIFNKTSTTDERELVMAP